METLGHEGKKMMLKKFKSYYVVWKPHCFVFFVPFFIEFKSYYVVWKHFFRVYEHLNANGLNRTMQYGNNVYRGLPIYDILCLNRTMQYGNMYWLSSEEEKKLCLNRTMQYGNQIKRPCVRLGFPLFKSYYVVWKLL